MKLNHPMPGLIFSFPCSAAFIEITPMNHKTLQSIPNDGFFSVRLISSNFPSWMISEGEMCSEYLLIYRYDAISRTIAFIIINNLAIVRHSSFVIRHLSFIKISAMPSSVRPSSARPSPGLPSSVMPISYSVLSQQIDIRNFISFTWALSFLSDTNLSLKPFRFFTISSMTARATSISEWQTIHLKKKKKNKRKGAWLLEQGGRGHNGAIWKAEKVKKAR